MNQIDRDVAQAVKVLSDISKTSVPRASSQAINRIATRAVSRSVQYTAKATKLKQKVIRPRASISKASVKRPVAFVNVRRFDIPAISIDTVRTQIRRRKGQLRVSAAQRDSRGRYIQRQESGHTSIRVGRHVFQDAFLQKLRNGRWHVMQRTSDARYPIKVCKVPIAAPMTYAFKRFSTQLMKTDMSRELRSALQNQIRLQVKRRG